MVELLLKEEGFTIAARAAVIGPPDKVSEVDEGRS
jgi:hypothetical protein